ncbi:MAG TPA: hypothetical protein VGL69_18065 [Solirubrobacteraceae bacterium]|jgi:hypothetical protein
MSESVPLSALLSRALVAFTIELDNTWESRTPHRTTRFGGPRGAVYATSLVCWSNFMRAVPDQGVSIAELERTVRARLPLDGMRRWRYVTIAPDPGDQRARVPRREWRITPTLAGLGAQSVWRGLPEEIEQRWARRFGASTVAGLREDLEALVRGLRLTDLPQWLTGHYGGYAGQELEFSRGTPAAAPDEWPLPFSALLSQVLQGLALEYETDSPAPLSYSANVLRLLGEDGIMVSGLRERSGIAIEPLRVALRILAKRRFIGVGPEPGAGRSSQARLLGRGLAAQALYRDRPPALEAGWCGRAGHAPVRRLRATLEAIVTAPAGERAPMWLGLDPTPESWRSRVPAPDVLPDFPMPRQSGHPDGA